MENRKKPDRLPWRRSGVMDALLRRPRDPDGDLLLEPEEEDDRPPEEE